VTATEHGITDPETRLLSSPRKGSVLASWLSSTDHKIIGYLYLITSFGFFLFGGILAMIMRAQLMGPHNHIVSDQQYNELFTMHGTIMLLLFATPLFVGFTNVIMPLQIGAPDVAFPRLNLLSWYLFTFGGLILVASFLTPGGSAAFGWYAYAPLTSSVYSPGVGPDMWIMGLTLSGLSTILGGVNFVTTIFCMRAPGMTMFRMPIFTWNALLTSILALLAFPVLAAALLVLEIGRKLGAHVFDASSANSAAASTGKASSTSTAVSSTFHTKIGMRNIVMPGARMQMMVVMKLTAPRIVPKPEKARPMIHMSAPTPGERTASDSGL